MALTALLPKEEAYLKFWKLWRKIEWNPLSAFVREWFVFYVSRGIRVDDILS